MTNAKTLKKVVSTLWATAFCLSVVLFSGFQNMIPNIALSTKAVATEEIVAEFLNSGFNNSNVNIYDGTAENKSFNMMGRTFAQGLKFDDEGSPYYGTISFNVENIDSISFTLGHIDVELSRNVQSENTQNLR